MPLKNYTTGVPAMRSIGQIQGNLVAHGASSILIHYGDDKRPESLSFLVTTPGGEIPFQLPANIKKVEAILIDMRARKLETWHSDYERVMERVQEQASRVAWRILKDWVDAQLAIIETEMVVLEQVFLPYMETGGGTLYEVLREKKFYLGQGEGNGS